MEEDSKPDSGKKPEPTNPPPTILDKNKGDEIINEHEKKGALPNDGKGQDNSIPQINIQLQNAKGFTKQDTIAISGVIVSAILFIVTLATFIQTKRSVDISQQALKDARFNDSVVRFRDSVKYYNDSILEAKKFAMENTAIQIQINALKENHEYSTLMLPLSTI